MFCIFIIFPCRFMPSPVPNCFFNTPHACQDSDVYDFNSSFRVLNGIFPYIALKLDRTLVPVFNHWKQTGRIPN